MILISCFVFVLSALAQANAVGHCVMHGECNMDDITMLSKPCVYNGSPIPLNDSAAIVLIKDICPSLETGDGFALCCNPGQVDILSIQLAALASIFKRCPSCYHNVANLFCHLVCSPNQSLFLKVTAIGENNSVNEVSYYITEDFVTGLFDSCKDVKLPFATEKAISLACGINGKNCNPHLWVEFMGGHDPSPYQINFHYETNASIKVNNTTFNPMNATIIPCSEPVNPNGSACSCDDCYCSNLIL